MRRLLCSTAAVLIGGLVCVGAQSPSPSGTPAEGVWGGNQARLLVSPTDVRLQVHCLAGHLDAPLTLDKGGAFRLQMRLAPIRGVQIDGEHDDVPVAEIAGTVTRDTLQLVVGPSDRDGAGTYRLTRGGKATLPNCRLRS